MGHTERPEDVSQALFPKLAGGSLNGPFISSSIVVYTYGRIIFIYIYFELKYMYSMYDIFYVFFIKCLRVHHTLPSQCSDAGAEWLPVAMAPAGVNSSTAARGTSIRF